MAVPDTENTENIIIYNNAFCSICSYFQSRPTDGDPEYDLHDIPFVHTENLNTEDMSIVGAGGLADNQFEAGSFRNLSAVSTKTVRRVEAVEVLFPDGHRRSAVVCDPRKWKKFNF